MDTSIERENSIEIKVQGSDNASKKTFRVAKVSFFVISVRFCTVQYRLQQNQTRQILYSTKQCAQCSLVQYSVQCTM